MKSMLFEDEHTSLTEGGCSHTLAQPSDHDSDDWIETDKNPPGDGGVLHAEQ